MLKHGSKKENNVYSFLQQLSRKFKTFDYRLFFEKQ